MYDFYQISLHISLQHGDKTGRIDRRTANYCFKNIGL